LRQLSAAGLSYQVPGSYPTKAAIRLPTAIAGP